MRWRGRRGSENVEDRRGMSPGRAAAGGGIVVVVITLIATVLGKGDPRDVLKALNQMQQQQGGGDQPAGEFSAKEQEWFEFAKVMLADTEEVWTDLFAKAGREYRKPTMVPFSNSVDSACGSASSATGPFYCPGDEKVYIDLLFFEEMEKLGAPGDAAQAYVIAHEVGHHVQNLLGVLPNVQGRRQRMSEAEANELLVRLELQADFYAGVCFHHAHEKFNVLEEGDVDEALEAAAAIGDDRLQKKAQGYVVEESFTHGTSAQRSRWLRHGLTTGDMNQGDTFSARDL